MDFFEDIFEMFTGGHRRHDERNKRKYPHGGHDDCHSEDNKHYNGRDDKEYAKYDNGRKNYKTCSKCSREVFADDNFCPGCGNRIEAVKQMPCINCQRPVIPGAAFCGVCGQKI